MKLMEQFIFIMSSHIQLKKIWRLGIPKDYESKRLSNFMVLFNVENRNLSKGDMTLVSVYKPHLVETMIKSFRF